MLPEIEDRRQHFTN